jgi:hypothetical protein
MRLLSLVGVFLIAVTTCSAVMAQAKPDDGPPAPSTEYSLQQWVDYSSVPGRYKTKFPKSPRESTQVQGDVGRQSTVYITEHQGILLYVTTFADLPERVPDAKVYLSNLSEGWLEANSARNLKVIKNEDISFNGNPARFLQVETPRDVVRARWVVVKDRIYYQFVAAPKHQNAMDSENGYEKLAMGFLNSFEITK